MDKLVQEALKRLREIKSVTFAAVRDGYPTARTIDVMFVDESGLFFLTGRGKSFYRQLKALPYGGDCAFPRRGVNPRQETSNRAN